MGNFSRRVQLIVGAATLIAVAAATYFVFNGAALLNSGTRQYEAEFSSVLNIVPNASEVRVNGVEVGTVVDVDEDINSSTGVVTIGLDDPKIMLHTDAHASLRLKSFLGEKYIDLDPGKPEAPELPPGSRLSLEQNEGTADLGTLLGAGKLLADIPAEDLTETLSLSAETIETHGGQLAGLVTGMRNGLDAMVSRRDELFGMLDDTDHLLSTIVAQNASFGRISASARTTMASVKRLVAEHKTDAIAVVNDLMVVQDVLSEHKQTLSGAVDTGYLELRMARRLINMLVRNLDEGCYPMPISITNFGLFLDRDVRPPLEPGACY